MSLFNFFKKRETKSSSQTAEDFIYNLINSDDSNVFAFDKKYANREEVLLSYYGNARELNKNIKIIIVTDTHNSLREEEFKNFILEHPNYDLCLLLGDFGSNDIPIILKYIDKNKIYALLGNHDYNYIDEYNLNNLNGKIININGVKLLGIEGSFKYKPVDFPSFSQKDSIRFLYNKEEVDILVSHDMGFNSDSERDPAHQGLFGITYYLFKHKVPYHIHGHIHNPYRKDMINGTHEISAYMFEYLEI